MLRRRTGEIISLLLLGSVLASVVGVIYVACNDPHRAIAISFLACVAAFAVGFLLVLLGLATFFAVLANGIYALLLVGVPFQVVAIVASLLVGFVFAILARGLIAAGSADEC